MELPERYIGKSYIFFWLNYFREKMNFHFSDIKSFILLK